MVDRYATVNGLRIHYVDWGTSGKQPLVLLHGIARCARNFDHLAPRFTDRHHVIAIDLRGHGDSAWSPDAAYLVDDYVGDVKALVEQLGLRNIVWWGNSTGGRVAQVMAGRHPELTAAVIVEDVGPERPAAISNRRASRMAQEEAGWASVDELIERTRATYPRVPEPILRHFVAHASKRRDDGRIVWKRDPAIQKGFIPTELWTDVANIKAPIVYILGGASDIVPAETQERLKQLLPQVQIVTMPGLGHYPSDDDADAFVNVSRAFLA